MGLFFDLYQQSQISSQQQRSANLADRVSALEAELLATRTLLRDVIHRLEKNVGTDLDNDGKVG
jgi:hypothetical protein